jgi:hypothetical protein
MLILMGSSANLTSMKAMPAIVGAKDGMAGMRPPAGVSADYGTEIRTLLERQPLNPFKRMEFRVLSFRPATQSVQATLGQEVIV